MPRGNGMGPNGLGPMTGRGMGFCAGSDLPGYLNCGYGGGYGRGLGLGFRHQGAGRGGYGFGPGWGFRAGGFRYPGYGPDFYAPTPEEEKGSLKNYADGLRSRLEEIESRIRELSDEEKS